MVISCNLYLMLNSQLFYKIYFLVTCTYSHLTLRDFCILRKTATAVNQVDINNHHANNELMGVDVQYLVSNKPYHFAYTLYVLQLISLINQCSFLCFQSSIFNLFNCNSNRIQDLTEISDTVAIIDVWKATEHLQLCSYIRFSLVVWIMLFFLNVKMHFIIVGK